MSNNLSPKESSKPPAGITAIQRLGWLAVSKPVDDKLEKKVREIWKEIPKLLYAYNKFITENETVGLTALKDIHGALGDISSFLKAFKAHPIAQQPRWTTFANEVKLWEPKLTVAIFGLKPFLTYLTNLENDGKTMSFSDSLKFYDRLGKFSIKFSDAADALKEKVDDL